MSTMRRVTLIGLYNYDDKLFDNLILPEGYDKDTFIESLLLEHGEKCVLYPDPDFLKYAIGIFSRKWGLELERIYEALSAEYNPIENYDRYEDITDDYIRGTTSTTSADYNHDRTADLAHTTTQITESEVEHMVSAYNESTYQPADKTTEDVGEVKETDTGTDKVQVHGKVAEVVNTGTDTTDHEAHIHGNIGVTTASTMISESVQMRITKNLYDVATRLFANELLIQLY